MESVTVGGEHAQSGKEKPQGPPELPLTVSGCTGKNDPKMSEDKLKELQESIAKTKLDQKAEKKADKKAEKRVEKDAAKNENEEKKTKMTAKAKSNPKGKAKSAASKKVEDEETDTLDSEEPLTESDEDESGQGEAEDKVGVLGICGDCKIYQFGHYCTSRILMVHLVPTDLSLHVHQKLIAQHVLAIQFLSNMVTWCPPKYHQFVSSRSLFLAPGRACEASHRRRQERSWIGQACPQKGEEKGSTG